MGSPMLMIIFLLSVDDNIFAPVNPDVWDIYLGGDYDGPPIFELEVYQDIQENYIEDKTLIGDIGGASMLTIQFSSIAISESFTIEYTIHIENEVANISNFGELPNISKDDKSNSFISTYSAHKLI